MDNKKLISTIVIILVLVAGGVGFWYWSRKGGQGIFPRPSAPAAQELSPAAVEESLGGQIFEQTQNPLKGRLPPTNPFEKTETNPLKDVYQNPF